MQSQSKNFLFFFALFLAKLFHILKANTLKKEVCDSLLLTKYDLSKTNFNPIPSNVAIYFSNLVQINK